MSRHQTTRLPVLVPDPSQRVLARRLMPMHRTSVFQREVHELVLARRLHRHLTGVTCHRQHAHQCPPRTQPIPVRSTVWHRTGRSSHRKEAS